MSWQQGGVLTYVSLYLVGVSFFHGIYLVCYKGEANCFCPVFDHELYDLIQRI